MIPHSYLNLAIHCLEDKGYFIVYDKDRQNLCTKAFQVYQTTVPLKFLIIIHNYANVWTIKIKLRCPAFEAVAEEVKTTRSIRLNFRLANFKLKWKTSISSK